MEDHEPAVGRDPRLSEPAPALGDKPLIGAQISTAGGFRPVPGRAVALGAEAVQVFSSNPRTWHTRTPDEAELSEFVDGLRAHRLPLFFHTIYLINLASPDRELRERSAGALAHALTLGALAGATGVVTHVGSHRGEGLARGLRSAAETILVAVEAAGHALKAAASTPPLPPLLVETAVGAGSIVGARLEELAGLVSDSLTRLEASPTEAAASGVSPVGVCLDSAHLFAAGYPVHHPEGLESFMTELQGLDLLRRVGLVHLNDSASAFASNRDRHENPGDGSIGYDGLAGIVRHPALIDIPFVLEVPGGDGRGPDATNVAVVKSMRRDRPHGRAQRGR